MFFIKFLHVQWFTQSTEICSSHPKAISSYLVTSQKPQGVYFIPCHTFLLSGTSNICLFHPICSVYSFTINNPLESLETCLRYTTRQSSFLFFHSVLSPETFSYMPSYRFLLFSPSQAIFTIFMFLYTVGQNFFLFTIQVCFLQSSCFLVLTGRLVFSEFFSSMPSVAEQQYLFFSCILTHHTFTLK